MVDNERIVVLPDIHAPNHNVKSLRAVIQFIEHYNPTTLIQLGDLCDWDSVTTFDPRKETDIVCIEDEVESACRVLRKIESSLSPSCRKVLIGGNHEERLTKWKVKFGHEIEMRRLKKVKDWWEYYRLKEHGWEWVQYGEVYKIGKLLFTHGFGNGGKNSAELHLKRFHKNIFFGHTHRFLTATWMTFDENPIMAASIGTLSNFNLSYLKGEPPNDWINMFATIEFMKNGKFTPHFIPIIDGKFIKDGMAYGV